MLMNQFSFRVRMLASVSLMCFLIVTVGWMGFTNARSANHSLRELFFQTNAMVEHLTIMEEDWSYKLVTVVHEAVNGHSSPADALAEIERIDTSIEKEFAALQATNQNAEELAISARIASERGKVKAFQKRFVDALRNKDTKTLETLSVSDLTPTIAAAIVPLQEHQKYQVKEAKEMEAEAESNYAEASRNMLIAVILAIVVGLGLSLKVAFDASGSLGEVLKNLEMGADQVAAGSSQVSSSSQQMAEGSSESASSLEQTSASLEEMAAMTRQNSANAQRAADLVEETRNMVSRGSEAVESTVSSMLKMSESADKVSRIIKTIEEIAFQTNLLALNAAVEAARAGEHGRGFAVVADEVRSLAGRSATAARDTAALIEENATRASQGVAVSHDAGIALKAIVQSSGKVAELVREIAAASAEQAKGIGEITSAVGQMERVVSGNAANAEELSSTSEEMSSQAKALRHLVGKLAIVLDGHELGEKQYEGEVLKRVSHLAQRREDAA